MSEYVIGWFACVITIVIVNARSSGGYIGGICRRYEDGETIGSSITFQTAIYTYLVIN